MNFTVTWFNPQRNLYDNFYLPSNYLELTKVRLTNNYNYSDYIDTELSLSQLHSYKNGYGLVDDIFNNCSDEVKDWIKGSCSNYSKFKSLVDKVQIR